MKKAICIILLLSTLLTVLASCKGVTVIEDQTETETETEAVTSETTEKSTADTNVETESVDDGIDHSFDWQYDYDFDYDSGSVGGDYIFNISIAGGHYLILKRNVHTGECTTVCTDPFCEHNSKSCPYYRTTEVIGVGNTVYGYMNDENINRYVFYSYNVDTNEKKNILESKVTISDLYVYKNYVYYKLKDTGFHRYNTITGETEKVTPYWGTFSFLRWGMIIFEQRNKKTGERTFTATDLLGNDPKPFNPQIYMGSNHESAAVEDNVQYTKLLKLDRAGNVEKVLVEMCRTPIVVGGNRVYLGPVDDGVPRLYDPKDPSKGTMYSNGDIFILPLDTEESRLLCHVDGVNIIGFSDSHNKLICGDWIGIYISPNYPTSTDKISVYNDMVIVNMKTGEYHISRYIE